MTRRFNYDCFRSGIRFSISVEITEKTTFSELTEQLVQAIKPLDERVTSIGTFSRGSMIVFGGRTQIGIIKSIREV